MSYSTLTVEKARAFSDCENAPDYTLAGRYA